MGKKINFLVYGSVFPYMLLPGAAVNQVAVHPALNLDCVALACYDCFMDEFSNAGRKVVCPFFRDQKTQALPKELLYLWVVMY